MDDTRTSQPLARTNIETSRTDRHQSLDALHTLELDAASASPGRERDWLARLRQAITHLEHSLGVQEGHSGSPDSLLSDVERDEPRLRRRVQQLRLHYRAIHDDVTELSRQLSNTTSTDMIDVADIRQRVARLASELRYQRAREADIIYEAYTVDLGAGD